jgi:HSP20 family protein
MDLVRWDPFNGLDRIQSQINEFFDEALGRPRTYPISAAASTWYPPVDILESRDAYLIRAELPGMKKEDINLEFSDGAVTLSGERKYEEPAAGVEYHRAERVTGKFLRSFSVPQTIRQDEMKATYRDGILEIHIPKAEEAKAKQIAISVN